VEPLPGYRLLELLGRGGFGEVWKCQAPGGFLKAIKFVGGTSNPLLGETSQAIVQQEFHALQLLKTLRHPFLLSVERVEVLDGQLLILTELADCSLQDLLVRCVNAGHPGIPREDLLGYFREAAEVLDLMNHEHGLQHLDVKPRNLFLVGYHVKVGDFGLVGSLTELYGPDGQSAQLEMVSPLYAAPERFTGKVSMYSDQYSLAVSYVELLTGQFPFPGKNYADLARQHINDEPDLSSLPEADRAPVRKALSKDPRQRFPSCLDLIMALLGPDAGAVLAARPSRFATPLVNSRRPEEKDRKKPLTKHDLRLGDPGSTVVTPETLPSREVPVTPVREEPAPAQLPSHDPLAGWTFLDCLGRFLYGEFWRVRPPVGFDHLVKFIFGFEPKLDRDGCDPLDLLRNLCHPALIPVEIFPTPGRLVVRSPWQGRTLIDRFDEAVTAELPGIPRENLLEWLGVIAEALDDLREWTGLSHLALNPWQLVLDDEDHIQLLDFGMVELVWKAAGQDPAAFNTRYSAPELFAGQSDPRSDQYSLALIFAELLCGAHPFRNLNQRQMASPRTRGQPDLNLLPTRDRPILTTALDPDPRYRFSSCRELINALVHASKSHQGQPTSLRQATALLPSLLRGPAMFRALRQLTEQSACGMQVREFGELRYLLRPGKMATHQCYARLIPSTAPLKLAGFREQWRAHPVKEEEGRFAYQVRFPPRFLDRLFGRHPGLDVLVTVEDGIHQGSLMASINIELRPISCSHNQASEMLEDVGPLVLESLRKFLQAAPERRKLERFSIRQAATIYPLLEDDDLGEGIPGEAHDVCLTGLGVFLPRAPEGTEVAVHLRGHGPHNVLLAGQIVRQAVCKDGRYDIGLWFGDLPPS
jgi:serine/threonine protein kinase